MQIGRQKEVPKPRRKAQTEQVLGGLASLDSGCLKSALQFLTPEEKKPDQTSSEKNTKKKEVSRLSKDALNIIRQNPQSGKTRGL